MPKADTKWIGKMPRRGNQNHYIKHSYIIPTKQIISKLYFSNPLTLKSQLLLHVTGEGAHDANCLTTFPLLYYEFNKNKVK